jgi:serine/threonine protein kinase
MTFENVDVGAGSSYWRQQPPGFASASEFPTGDVHPGIGDRENDPNPASPDESHFDYLHFVQFLAVRNIELIDYADLIFEDVRGFPAGRGCAMQVSFAQWKSDVVAVKSLRQDNTWSSSATHSWREKEKWLHDLYFELQVMSHRPLCEHPNIVQLKGISFSDGGEGYLRPLLVVEPACREHADLTHFVLSRSENLEPEIAAHIISDTADGISVLHVYGVVHGDLKPDNVLIFPSVDRPNGFTAKIADFGFSGSRLSEDSPRGYTPAWAAPECLPDAPPSLHRYRNEPLQDIFSFALVAAFVLLRRYPISPGATNTAEAIVTDLQCLAAEYPWIPRLLDPLRQCLNPDPLARQLSFFEIRAAIFEYVSPVFSPLFAVGWKQNMDLTQV